MADTYCDRWAGSEEKRVSTPLRSNHRGQVPARERSQPQLDKTQGIAARPHNALVSRHGLDWQERGPLFPLSRLGQSGISA